MQQLQKFSFAGDLAEDRLRLLAEGADGYRCAWWLTRRLTAAILSNAERWLTEKYASQMNVPAPVQSEVYDHYHDQARDQYEQQQVVAPVAEVKVEEMALLQRIDIAVDAGGLKLLLFSGGVEAGWAWMSVTDFHQLLHILQIKTGEMEWGLAPTQLRSPVALQ